MFRLAVVTLSVLASLLEARVLTKSASGSAASDNWPGGSYAANSRQRLAVVQASAGSSLVFSFATPFEVEASAWGGCYDYVRLVSGQYADQEACSDVPVLARFCGTTAPSDFRTSESTVLVEFCSDSSVNLHGFSVSWSQSTTGTTTPHSTQSTKTPTVPSVTTARPPQTTSQAAAADCGVSDPSFPVTNLQRIIGGNDANPHSWPWAAVLFDNNGYFRCGGSVINEQWVMTAGHCFYGTSTSTGRQFHFKLGASNKGSSDSQNEASQQVRQVADFFIHPDYVSSPVPQNDMTLVKLDQPLDLNEYVKPVCLPTNHESFQSGQSMVAIGWGQTESGDTNLLKQAEVPYVDHDVCAQEYAPDGLTVDDTMICAGVVAGGEGVCYGDSGGALMTKRDGKYYVEGTISWGIGCATAGHVQVYGSVTHMVDWAQETIQANG